jgi:hypothetical protein
MKLPNLGIAIPDVYCEDMTKFTSLVDAQLGQFKTVTLTTGSSGAILDANIKTTSVILYERSTAGGTLGHLSYAIVNGTSYTFTSSSATDTSTIVYKIVY